MARPKVCLHEISHKITEVTEKLESGVDLAPPPQKKDLELLIEELKHCNDVVISTCTKIGVGMDLIIVPGKK